jgi:hypothetical protein
MFMDFITEGARQALLPTARMPAVRVSRLFRAAYF